MDHELRPQGLEPKPEAMRAGSVVHEVLERLYGDPPGSDRIPRPGDLGHWRSRASELLAEVAEEHGLEPGRPLTRIALERMTAQVHRLLERESRSETDLRPALLEASFDEREGADQPVLDLGDMRLHGQIDRVDVSPDGRQGLVYDYKTGAKVWAAARLAEEGKLQLQLYARAVRDRWGIQPVGGLYYQLGGSGDPTPRGFVSKDVPGTEGLELTRTDRLEPEQVEEIVEAGVERAREKAAAMRSGINRPGAESRQVPGVVQLPADLPTRAGDGARGTGGRRREPGPGLTVGAPEQLALVAAEPAAEPTGFASERTEPQRAAIAARQRDVFTEAGAGAGKTGVLVERYCDCVTEDEVPPDRILAFTFTERARRRAPRAGPSPPVRARERGGGPGGTRARRGHRPRGSGG